MFLPKRAGGATSSKSMTADEVIAKLGLSPHPEGGYFLEAFKDDHAPGGRAASTAIYYLLRAGQKSAWHRVDAAEVWHYYAGAALELCISSRSEPSQPHMLGSDITNGERPQIVVPRGAWQSARSTGEWTLVGCTVAPGFEFEFFELAPAGWAPKTSST